MHYAVLQSRKWLIGLRFRSEIVKVKISDKIEIHVLSSMFTRSENVAPEDYWVTVTLINL